MLDEKDLQAIGGLIDTKLTQQKTEIFSELDSRFAQQKVEFDSRFAQQKTELLSEIDSRFIQQNKEIDSRLAQQKKEIIAESTHNMNVIIESKIQPQLNLLAENQQLIISKLIPVSRVDALEEEVGFLKSVVRQLADDIQALKKAN